MMKEKAYNLKFQFRGEEVVYSDADLSVTLERSYCSGHRIYCDSTSGKYDGLDLPFSKRRQIIMNLCAEFNTTQEPIIFVLHEDDRDRVQFEQLFRELIAKGHRITIEQDSEAKQRDFQEQMIADILSSGKEVYIEDTKIESLEEYRKLKGYG